MAPADSHALRRNRLGRLIAAARPLFRPQPFVDPAPPWCDRHPALTATLLALSDAEVERLGGDPAALHDRLRGELPDLEAIQALTAMPRFPAQPLPALPAHADWEVPGRKLAEVDAFAAALGQPLAPLVDWCAGKSHLGRRIAARWQLPACAVDHDDVLNSAGLALARRARLEAATATSVDVLADSAALRELLAGRHVVALHACGDLHRRLVDLAPAAGVAGLDFSPCCYGRFVRGGTAGVVAGAPDAEPALAFDGNELRLAVTGTATAAPRETRLRYREARWKLGFMALLAAGEGFAYRPLPAIPTAFLRQDFRDFCERVAEREGLRLPPAADFDAAEAEGARRWRRAERLGLVRLAYRRAIEVWLVLDLAARLESAGMSVRVGSFCEAALTPRNLLVSARPKASRPGRPAAPAGVPVAAAAGACGRPPGGAPGCARGEAR